MEGLNESIDVFAEEDKPEDGGKRAARALQGMRVLAVIADGFEP